MKKKFLFLYIQAGGGHISTAKALAKYMECHYRDTIDPVLIDGFTDAPRWLKMLIIDGYKQSQIYAQRAFAFLYRCNKRWVIAKITQVILSWLLNRYIKKMIREQQPSHIVILHFFLVRPTVHMLKKLNMHIPVTTIITDPFTLNPLRNLDRKMHYVVFSEQAKNTIVQRRVPAEQIEIFPVILKEEFSTPMSQDHIITKKQELGISLDQKVLFIMGAGDGMPQGEKILQKLIDAQVDAQIVMVCGKNKQLFHTAQKIAHCNPQYTIKIFGFVDFMYDLVNIADIIITKGGPATLMEILLMNKIPVINSYIREQEKGNMEFVVQNNVGIYQPNITKLVTKVATMLNSDLSSYHTNIRNLHLKNGTADVAEYLVNKVLR